MKSYINDSSEKTKTGETFSFLFFFFLVLFLFLFFSFKKIFEVGQRETHLFFIRYGVNFGGGQGGFRNEIGKVPDRLFLGLV
tara:strand:- start:552 stop:797 length:246 start_codon:yes stop_codon:yes gene_type:complete